MKPRIFIYGFSDYASVRSNPSAVVARGLKGYSPNKVEIRSAVFRVAYVSVRRQLRKILDRQPYDAVIGFGAAPGSRIMRLEKRARKPPMAKAGKRFLDSNLKLAPILRALARKKIRTRVSYDAGTYLCNFSYYITASIVKARRANTKYCFIHLPLVRVRKRDGTYRYVSGSKSLLMQASRAILDAVVYQLSAKTFII